MSCGKSRDIREILLYKLVKFEHLTIQNVVNLTDPVETIAEAKAS